MDSLVNDAKSAWKREGLLYVIKNAPRHLIRKYGPDPYSLFEYFALGREDLVSHCRNQGQIWYYDSGTQFEMSPPLNNEVPTEYEELIGTRFIESNFVCEVSNAKLVGPYAIPVSPNGKIIMEIFGTSTTFQSRIKKTLQELGKTKSLKLLLDVPTTNQISTHYDTVAHLVVRHGPNYDNPNYGHWINENLPQLQAIEHYKDSTGENVKLLINRNPPSWLREILKYMGYSSDDWIVWNKQIATIDKLIIPQLNYIHSWEAIPNPVGKQWARRRAIMNLEKPGVNVPATSRIFMSRQGSQRRKILNFGKISDVLKEYDFSIVRPEDISIQEEVYLFSGADVIVGVAGSNIAGIIFSSDATLVEILPAYMPVYHTLANEMNLEYRCIYDNPDDIGIKHSNHQNDVILNPDRLRETLEQTFENATNDETTI